MNINMQDFINIIKSSEALNEVRIIGIHKYGDDEPPLKDDESIRVYHGTQDISFVYTTARDGMSGDRKIHRTYSYENNNNPKGLFVTPDINTAKRFGKVIIEFNVKVSDLESPVWPNGTFTVQGQMSGMFANDDERNKARDSARKDQRQNSEYENIKNSDRPELAALLLLGGERQALFTGNINPNSINAIWYRSNPNSSTAPYQRVSPKQFIKSLDNGSLPDGYKLDNVPKNKKVLKPRDLPSGNEFLTIFKQHKKLDMEDNEIIDIFIRNPEYIQKVTWSDSQAKHIMNELIKLQSDV